MHQEGALWSIFIVCSPPIAQPRSGNPDGQWLFQWLGSTPGLLLWPSRQPEEHTRNAPVERLVQSRYFYVLIFPSGLAPWWPQTASHLCPCGQPMARGLRLPWGRSKPGLVTRVLKRDLSHYMLSCPNSRNLLDLLHVKWMLH